MEPASRILLIRPSALGDVCRTVPVLVSLRRAYPDAIIDWLVQDTYVPAIAAHPDLNEAIPFPRRRFAAWWRPSVALGLRRWLGDLRRRRYDLVVDCQGLGRSGLFTWMTGARRRVGWRDAREFAWLGYNRRHDVEPGAHAIDAMLTLLEAEGVPVVRDLRLHIDEDDRVAWAERRSRDGLADPYLVFAATARWQSKQWPAERWCQLVDQLRSDDQVVLVGAPGEEAQVEALRERPRVHSVVGELTIGQTMAAIAGARAVVAHDSAPLHMAAGFGRPSVALFGPTDPTIVGPYGDSARVVGTQGAVDDVNYRRASDELMRHIAVDEVLAALEDVAPVGATP